MSYRLSKNLATTNYETTRHNRRGPIVCKQAIYLPSSRISNLPIKES